MRPQLFGTLAIGLAVAALGLLLLGRPSSTEKTGTPDTPPGQRQVRVTGEALVPAQADLAWVKAAFTVRGATPLQVQERYDERLGALSTALAAAGVRPGDFQVGLRRVYRAEDFLSPGPANSRVREFEVRITVRDLRHLEEVINAAWGADATDAWVELYGIQDPEPLRRQAVKLAIANAQERADIVAAAGALRLRSTIDTAVVLDESRTDSQSPGPTATTPDALWVRATATVTYEHRP